MAKEKEVKEDKSADQRIEELSATVGAIQSEIKRHSENWKRHMMKFHDEKGDGKVGGARVWALIGLLAVSVATAFAFSPVSGAIWELTDSTGTNVLASVSSSGSLVLEGTFAGSATNISQIEDSLTINTNLVVSGSVKVSGGQTNVVVVVLNGGLTVAATGGAVVLGTNVSLQAVTVPASGGQLSLGTNVVLAGVQSLAGGTVTIGTNWILKAVQVPLTGGITTLGTNVTLNAPRLPLTGGITTLGTNVVLNAVQVPLTGGPLTLGTNVVIVGTLPIAGGVVTFGTNWTYQGGYSGIVTNHGVAGTNVLFYSHGMITNVVSN